MSHSFLGASFTFFFSCCFCFFRGSSTDDCFFGACFCFFAGGSGGEAGDAGEGVDSCLEDDGEGQCCGAAGRDVQIMLGALEGEGCGDASLDARLVDLSRM